MKLLEEFQLFCENAEIKIESSLPIQEGVQLVISRYGVQAEIVLFDNGLSHTRGIENSSLLKLLQAWTNTRPGGRFLSFEERRAISSMGLPAFYLSWREWKEDARLINDYIEKHGVPDETIAPDDFKMHREFMFHNYMFKKATDLNISLDSVRHIIKSWLLRFCFMNIDSEALSDEVIRRIRKNWRADITEDGYVPFYDVLEEITYVFSRFCHDKWVVCERHASCPQMGDDDMCIFELVDSMYVYCQNQKVLSYTKTNMHRLLHRDLDNLTWIDLKSASPIEIILGDALYQSGILTIPQFQALAPVKKYKVDFLVKAPNGGALAIECDGLEYHANPQAYVNDRKRDVLLTTKGFQVLRFSSVDILNDLNGCVKQIEECFSNFQHGRVVYHRNGGLGYFGSNL